MSLSLVLCALGAAFSKALTRGWRAFFSSCKVRIDLCEDVFNLPSSYFASFSSFSVFSFSPSLKPHLQPRTLSSSSTCFFFRAFISSPNSAHLSFRLQSSSPPSDVSVSTCSLNFRSNYPTPPSFPAVSQDWNCRMRVLAPLDVEGYTIEPASLFSAGISWIQRWEELRKTQRNAH